MAWSSVQGVLGRSPSPSSWRILGIPIRIDRSWIVLPLLLTWSLSRGYFPSVTPGLSGALYWAMGVVSALALFGCVLLHELGHAVAARALGVPVAGVTLFIFGGVAQIRQEPRRPAVELLVALAGPLVSAIIAIGCRAAGRAIVPHSQGLLVLAAIVRYLAMINIGLLLFNLLPGFPLDGGRVVRAVLWALGGSLPWATRIASLLGSVLGVGLIGLGVWSMLKGAGLGGLWYILLGGFLRNSARSSSQHASRRGGVA